MSLVSNQLVSFPLRAMIEKGTQLNASQKKVALLALAVLAMLAIAGFYLYRRFWANKEINWLDQKPPGNPICDALKEKQDLHGKIIRVNVGGVCLESAPCQHPNPKLNVIFEDGNEFDIVNADPWMVYKLMKMAPAHRLKGYSIGHFELYAEDE